MYIVLGGYEKNSIVKFIKLEENPLLSNNFAGLFG